MGKAGLARMMTPENGLDRINLKTSNQDCPTPIEVTPSVSRATSVEPTLSEMITSSQSVCKKLYEFCQ